MTRPDGVPVNAVFGFTNMLAKLLREHVGTHFAVIFDAGRITFRNRLYDAYKAHRPPPPEELIPQFALVREATDAFCVPAIELTDWEADDLIAAYAREATQAGGQVTIVSSDKDLMQLIRPGVEMLDPIRQKPIGPAEVMEKFGVPPEKMIDVQALIGDSTDNVPGIPGIGPKRAAELVNEYGDLEAVLAAAPAMKPGKRRDFADRARRLGADVARTGDAARRCADAGAARSALRLPDRPTEAGGVAARAGVPQHRRSHGPGWRRRRRGSPRAIGAARRAWPDGAAPCGGRCRFRIRFRTVRDHHFGRDPCAMGAGGAHGRNRRAAHRGRQLRWDARGAGRVLARYRSGPRRLRAAAT